MLKGFGRNLWAIHNGICLCSGIRQLLQQAVAQLAISHGA